MSHILELPNTLANELTQGCLLVSAWMTSAEESLRYNNCDFGASEVPPLVAEVGRPGIPVRMDRATWTFVRSRNIAYRWKPYWRDGKPCTRISHLMIDMSSGNETRIEFPFEEFLARYKAQSKEYIEYHRVTAIKSPTTAHSLRIRLGLCIDARKNRTTPTIDSRHVFASNIKGILFHGTFQALYHHAAHASSPDIVHTGTYTSVPGIVHTVTNTDESWHASSVLRASDYSMQPAWYDARIELARKQRVDVPVVIRQAKQAAANSTSGKALELPKTRPGFANESRALTNRCLVFERAPSWRLEFTTTNVTLLGATEYVPAGTILSMTLVYSPPATPVLPRAVADEAMWVLRTVKTALGEDVAAIRRRWRDDFTAYDRQCI